MELLATGFQALEGPTVDDDGALLFSDLRGGGVHRLARDGAVDVVVPERKAIGGICLHADGGLVLSGPDLCHARGPCRRTLLGLADIAERPGRVVVGFNDIAADPGGRLFAGVLRHDEVGERVPGELLWVSAEREHVVVHDDVHPNGIGVSPDGSRLYVADTFGRRLLVFRLADREPLSEISTAGVDGFPDGLAIDAEGCLWVAFYGGSCVVRFAPDGRILRRLPVPALKPLSVCLAGSALYIVTATRDPGSEETGSVYRMAVDVPPAPLHRVRI
jgi:sugar lactone lactonase YvrE